MVRLVGPEDLESGSRWDGDSIYVVAVLVIQNEEVYVAEDGSNGISTCLITLYCASDGIACCVYVVGVVEGVVAPDGICAIAPMASAYLLRVFVCVGILIGVVSKNYLE